MRECRIIKTRVISGFLKRIVIKMVLESFDLYPKSFYGGDMKLKNNSQTQTPPTKTDILDLLESTGKGRGFWTEERFFSAIKNSNGSAPYWYKDIIKTEEKMDRKGIDFIIYTIYGNIYVQTKSSDYGAKKFLRQSKIKRSKYKIIVLVIKTEYREEEIRNITFPAIQAEIDLFRRPSC